MGYKKCRSWRCGFNISTGKEHCPGCGFPTSLWGRVLVHLRIAPRGPSLRPAEAEVWKVIDKAQDEWQKLATLQGDLTGYHKPKMTPEQRAALNKRWKNGIPGYEGLFSAKTKAMDPSVFRLAVTIIRIREWISAKRTVRALADISSFTDHAGTEEGIPSDDVSEWLETIYDRDEQLQQLTHESLRLEAEEEVDRLLESS